MGGGSSKVTSADAEFRTMCMAENAQLLRSLNLKRKEGDQLFEVFNELDADKSHSVSFGEFCRFFRVDKTKFALRCFSLLDHKGQGEIHFKEFLLCCWNFCSYNRNGLIAFAFMLYDRDQNGYLDLDEMESVLHEVYDLQNSNKQGQDMGEVRESTDVRLQRVRQGIRRHMTGGKMELPEFSDYMKKHELALFPAFKLQHSLRTNIVGSAFWKKLERRRKLLHSIRDNLGNIHTINDPNDIVEIMEAIYGSIQARREKEEEEQMERDMRARHKARGNKGGGGGGGGGDGDDNDDDNDDDERRRRKKRKKKKQQEGGGLIDHADSMRLEQGGKSRGGMKAKREAARAKKQKEEQRGTAGRRKKNKRGGGGDDDDDDDAPTWKFRGAQGVSKEVVSDYKQERGVRTRRLPGGGGGGGGGGGMGEGEGDGIRRASKLAKET